MVEQADLTSTIILLQTIARHTDSQHQINTNHMPLCGLLIKFEQDLAQLAPTTFSSPSRFHLPTRYGLGGMLFGNGEGTNASAFFSREKHVVEKADMYITTKEQSFVAGRISTLLASPACVARLCEICLTSLPRLPC